MFNLSLFEVTGYVCISVIAIVYLAYFLIIHHFSEERNRVARRRIEPSVSLVIPTYNEELVIGKKLANVTELDYSQGKLEILVVDSGSTDRTRHIVREFCKTGPSKHPIRLLTQEVRSGKASALNYAMNTCRSEVFVLTDADVMSERDGLSKLVANLADARVGAVSAMEFVRNTGGSFSDRMERLYKAFYNPLRIAESNMDSVLTCESEFSAYKRNLLEPLSDDCMCDDLELTLGIRSKGFRAIYDAKVRFYEFEAPTLMSKFKHKMRRGQAIQQALLHFFGDVAFKKKYGRFGTLIFPMEFFAHVISPIALVIAIILFSAAIVTTGINFYVATAALATFIGLTSLSLLTLARSNDAMKNALQPEDRLLAFALSVPSFLFLQTCLFVALVMLLARGPQPSWESIKEIRELHAGEKDRPTKREQWEDY